MTETQATAGKTRTCEVLLEPEMCPALYGLWYYSIRRSKWCVRTFHDEATRDAYSKHYLSEGRYVRPFTIPAEQPSDRSQP